MSQVFEGGSRPFNLDIAMLTGWIWMENGWKMDGKWICRGLFPSSHSWMEILLLILQARNSMFPKVLGPGGCSMFVELILGPFSMFEVYTNRSIPLATKSSTEILYVNVYISEYTHTSEKYICILYMYDSLFWVHHLATAVAAPCPYEKHISSWVYHTTNATVPCSTHTMDNFPYYLYVDLQV